MPLSNQIILITGAGGGVGSTAALTLSQQGAQIILLDKSIPKLELIYDAIQASNGKTPILYPFDLAGANEQDYEELAERIAEKYGALHGLLHAAVEFKAFTPMCCLSTKEWGNTINVNLNAPFLLTKVLLPLLEKSTHSSIVFIGDSAVSQGTAYSGSYGVSKIALQGFAHILAAEYEAGKKIRVNTLLPGPIDSPLRKKAFPAEDKTRLPKLQTLAPIFHYLFGAESIGKTGQTLDARTFHL